MKTAGNNRKTAGGAARPDPDKQPAEGRAAAPRAVPEHLAVVFAGSTARAFAGVVCVGDLPAG